MNTDFYEEVANDANPEYKAKINDKINDLLSKELINDFEASNLKQGSRTPHFYGLPKIHKEYITFAPLRPICSGFNSRTAKMSEFIDAYLKPLAQNTSSYINETSDFVERIESDVASTTISSKTVLATMDVSSFYLNIDHEEGVKACEYTLNKHKKSLISTSVLIGLIMTVLKSNTLKFGERFFHQIEGPAMGTLMAVNFADLFMAKFETEMLAEYKKKFKKLPTVWL